VPGASLQASRAGFAVRYKALLVAGSDYSFLLTHGREFCGTFAVDNPANHANRARSFWGP
jgi:hypothetical protein